MTTILVARAYQQSFHAHPNTTLAFTGGTLNALGDVVAQSAQHVTKQARETDDPLPYDFIRTFRFFCYGFAISPFIGRWNSFLEHRFPLQTMSKPRSHQGAIKAVVKRVAYDQLIVAPIGLGLFLGSMGIMEGRSPAQIKDKFTHLYTPALVTNWQVWPLAQLINFRFMPLAYRVPFSSTCGVFWTLYLSILNSKEDDKQDRKIAKHVES